MNNTTTTPPVQTRLFNFNETKFSKTLKKLTPELKEKITIGVWALDPTHPNGCVNILSSDLSGEELDELISQAKYTTYTGSFSDLCALGVM